MSNSSLPIFSLPMPISSLPSFLYPCPTPPCAVIYANASLLIAFSLSISSLSIPSLPSHPCPCPSPQCQSPHCPLILAHLFLFLICVYAHLHINCPIISSIHISLVMPIWFLLYLFLMMQILTALFSRLSVVDFLMFHCAKWNEKKVIRFIFFPEKWKITNVKAL